MPSARCQSILAASFLCVSPHLGAVTLTDGLLSVNVSNDGSFHTVVLDGREFQTANSQFGFYIDGETGEKDLIPQSTVSVSDRIATYSARTKNGLDAEVTVSVLGAPTSHSGVGAVLEHRFVFTNHTDRFLPLATVVGTDPDLGLSPDIAEFDEATRSVVARDPTSNQLVAVIVGDPAGTAAFGFDVGPFFPDDVFPLEGHTGPVGPVDIALSIGLDYGQLASGDTATLVCRHFFAEEASSVPPDFAIPESAIFRRADCNDDREIDISDAVCILSWLFLGGDTPGCVAATNVDGVGEVDLTDPIYLLAHLFTGGPPPADPFPDCASGLSPLDDELGCATSPSTCP